MEVVNGTDPALTWTRCPGRRWWFGRCGWEGLASSGICPPGGGVVTCPRCGTPVETVGRVKPPQGGTGLRKTPPWER